MLHTRLKSFFKRLILFLLIFSFSNGRAQNFNPVEISGLSTGSIYDLLADSKGFIWIAHETGISRYDGNSFTHFQSPDQTGMAMTDILEDKQGRIWCHNFNGQLFYIEKEKMNLLEAYDNSKERSFQRTVIFDDELLATSDQGLFVCNTKTLQSHYITGNGTKTIAVVGDKAIMFGTKWMVYQKGVGVKLLKISREIYLSALRLQPLTTKDTLYSIEGSVGKFSVFKLLMKGDSLFVADKILQESKDNTITKDNNTIYIHTNTVTVLTDGQVIIKDYDLSDIVTDRQGNRWYSSLQKGLWFENNMIKWKRYNIPELRKNDYVSSLASNGSSLICGTNDGYIYCRNVKTGKTYMQKQVPWQVRAVKSMTLFAKNALLVFTDIGFLLFDTESGYLKELNHNSTIKKIAITDSLFMIAYSDSLTAIPLHSPFKSGFNVSYSIDVKEIGEAYDKMKVNEFLLRKRRCKSICYDRDKKIAYASFIDGMYSWQSGKFQLLQYQGKTAHAVSLVESLNKVFFSSFQGVFSLDGDNVIPLTRVNENKSDVVASLKAYKQYLFLIEKDELQVFDINTQVLLSTIPLPDNYNGLVYNIEVVDDKLYLANPSGLYTIDISSLQSLKEGPPVNYLFSVMVGDRDVLYTKNPVLKSSQNNLIFTFSAPGYVFPSHTFFTYQLKGSDDTSWHKMKEGEFSLSLASLKPGNYTLNAYATDYRKQHADKPISFHFIIEKPWWQKAWFITLVFLFVFTVLYLSVLYRFKLIRKRLKEKEIRQKQFDTQLLQSQINVQEQERKRIAEDLHDDIGATLSALHLHISTMSDAVMKQVPELTQFYKHSLLLASKAANDVRGISHDLLPKDFSELGLFAVLQNRIDELNATKAIHFTFITEGNEAQLTNIYSITIYRIVNEMISNVIKHSQAKDAYVQILITENEAQIMTEDDGIGINTIPAKRGIGMKNIQSRVDFLKGLIHIDSGDKGTVIIISIPIPPHQDL